MGKGSGDFHPCAFQFGLVVAFTAETTGGDIVGLAVLLDGGADEEGFFWREFTVEGRTGTALTETVLRPFVVGQASLAVRAVCVGEHGHGGGFEGREGGGDL
mmetsp:Transcript_52454/g.77631  ORF Transcript_52454/g.77631 Transcript_52454/m.77631 type:complete len:102 (+) Transcript_52454:1-306(+)